MAKRQAHERDDQGRPIHARDAEGRPICGAKRRDGGRCTSRQRKANGRCRLHGGNTPRGPASPHFKHGQHSRAYREILSGALLRGYVRVEDDAVLTSTREQQGVWLAREQELVELLADGAAPAWGRLAELAVEIRTAQQEGEAGTARLVAALEGVLELAGNGAGREETWRELERCTRQLARLKEVERRHREAERLSVPLEVVMAFVRSLVGLALEHIADGERAAAFAEDVRRLQAGRPPQLRA